jgi:hypothetical protein
MEGGGHATLTHVDQHGRSVSIGVGLGPLTGTQKGRVRVLGVSREQA